MSMNSIQRRWGGRANAIGTVALMILLTLLLALAQGRSVSANDQFSDEALMMNVETAAPFATTITVNSTEDITAEDAAENNGNKHTCGFSSGAFFFPANGSSAGLCTLRRAILEASARPQSDRPILIQFDIPSNDPNADLEVDGTWTIELDEVLPPLKTDTIINLNGEVTIDGSTQTGGRTDGPPIIIDTGDTSLEVESENNVIKDLSWKGGGAIFLKNKADGNTVQNMWMGLSDDGQEIHFRDTNDRKRLALGGLVVASDENTVAFNVISGAFAKAVNIDGGSDNIITQNYFGTRADGTIPDIPDSIKCLPSFAFDPENWYGGWGLALSGSRNEISSNVLLNMHIMRGANDTSPVAIEVFGADHLIVNNKIGEDINGLDVGVCGHGIKFSGSGHEIAQNVIAQSRVSFEDSDESAILASDTSPLFGQNLVYRNIVRDGPGDILTFANGIKDSLRFFKPARITKIDGTTVEGEAETDYPCPNCTIDLYLDDTDDIQEAFVWIGEVDADSDGKFTFEMANELPENRGIRTMATTNNSGVITGFGADTTTEASQLYTPITDIVITGTTAGLVGVDYTFNFMVEPASATLPISYSISTTDSSEPGEAVLDTTNVDWTHSWDSPGTKTIEVTADNGLSSFTKSYEVEISGNSTEGGAEDITFTGSPSEGFVDEEYVINFQVQPLTVTLPITFSVDITGEPNTLVGVINDRLAKVTYTWDSPGTKTIEVTADNGITSVTRSHTIEISENLMDAEITDLIISGPESGEIGTEYTFNLTVEPANVDIPIQFTLNVTDNDAPVGGTLNSRFATYRKTWSENGTKTIEVTADNGISSITKSFEITIGSSSGTPEATSTPSDPSGTPEATTTPSDPSGTPEATTTPSDPSGTPEATTTPSDPSGTPEATTTPSDPFGTPEPTTTPSDPFATATPSDPSSTPEATSTPSDPSSSDKSFIFLPMVRR